MLHPYIQQLLHKHQYNDRLKEVEQDRLIQLASHPASQYQTLVELSGLISTWWINRWNAPQEARKAETKIVMPEA